MKILVTANLAWNIWNFRRSLVESLLDEGHELVVLAPRDKSVANIESLGCSFHELTIDAKGLNPINDAELILSFYKIFKDLEPDVILSYTIKNNIFGALAARTLGIPFLPNVTGLGTAFLSGGFLEKVAGCLYRLAFNKLPVVFFQNEDDLRLFIQRGLVKQGHARRLPGSGVDLDRFAAVAYPDETEPPIFLMISRILRDKGVKEYLEAARRVKVNHPRVRFQLLGALSSENRTAISRDYIRTWERQGTIEYLGEVEDVRPLIQSSHCVVLPSYREGAPRTLIEAAAMARPLIATDVPGCRSVVVDGETGFLCSVKNVESLASTFERFIDLSSRARAEMGRTGREKIEREYDQSIVVDAYRSSIRELVDVK